MHARVAAPLLIAALGMLVGVGAEAAPEGRSASRSRDGRVYTGKPTVRRGSSKAVGKLPSLAERKAALVEVGEVSASGVLPEVAWAHLTVKAPSVDGRAALVFLEADAVDAKRGLAIFGGSPDTLTEIPEEWVQVCEKIGCPGLQQPGSPVVPARTMQVWVDADESKKYSVVCRAKFPDKKGDLVVKSEGGFTLTQPIDHTGKTYGTVSFLVDPSDGGWYGFTVFSPEAWSTPGCTVDELS